MTYILGFHFSWDSLGEKRIFEWDSYRYSRFPRLKEQLMILLILPFSCFPFRARELKLFNPEVVLWKCLYLAVDQGHYWFQAEIPDQANRNYVVHYSVHRKSLLRYGP